MLHPDPRLAPHRVPADAPGLRPRLVAQVARPVHLGQRRRRQHVLGELRGDPPRQVAHARPQAALGLDRRHRRRPLEVVAEPAGGVAGRAPCRELAGQRLERGRGEAERVEDRLPHTLRVRRARGTRDGLAQQLKADVRVLLLRAGRHRGRDLGGPREVRRRIALVRPAPTSRCPAGRPSAPTRATAAGGSSPSRSRRTGCPLPRSSGRCATTGSSRCRRPSSRSCMIAVAVKVLVIEAIR